MIKVIELFAGIGGGHRQPKIHIEGKSVRKLPPRECWGVMGFGNEQFNKVKDHISNAQLYKRARNSIAVPCLQVIFEKIFKEE